MFKLMSTDVLGRFWNIIFWVSSDKYVTSSCFAIWMLHVASVCTPWMLHVSSVYTPCCVLLDVVACCCAKFETGQTCQPTTLNISFVPWSPKRSATMLDPFAQLFQHCWGHARSLRMDYKDLWVVFFPRCTAGPKLVRSCCIRLHTTDNKHVTTPNIVGATVLRVVAPVCTQPNNEACLYSCAILFSIFIS